MAFEDEYTERQPQFSSTKGPITTWDTNPLFTLLAQLGSGILLLMQWGLALLVLPLIISFMPPTGPVDPIGITVMLFFAPLGAFQLYLAYRLYNRAANTLNLAFITAIVIVILSVTVIITSLATGTLAGIQLPAIQIGINVIIAYLTKLQEVSDHFDG
ncbi:MAG: hypothetical protein ACW98U_04220 [Candidatus Thorarchaeota archaeon]|jgi:hypothetical protein